MKSETRLPFYLILKYLKRGNKWTLFLTIFLMAVAFINLIFITSLFTGIIEGTNQQIISTYTGNIMATPSDGEDFIVDAEKVSKQVSNMDQVHGVSAETTVSGSLKYSNIKGNWPIIAIDPQAEKNVTNVSTKMIEGEYLDSSDTDSVIIGRQIAGGEGVENNAFSFKGAKIGEKVTLAFDGVSKELTIKGIFYTKFMDADKRAFITRKTLQSLLPESTNTATTIIIKTDKNSEKSVINKMEEQKINAKFYTWEDAAALMKSVTKSFLSINILMTIVGIMIAAVTIFIVIYVDIINKRRQIGILRAIGIKSYIISSTYVIQSAIYAVAGVILGTGIFYAVLVPYFNAHPFVLPICDATLMLNYADYIWRAEIIMWVAVISGFIPAVIVTRSRMLDAILGK